MMEKVARYQSSPELTFLLNTTTLCLPINNHCLLGDQLHHLDWKKVLKLANFHGLNCWLAECAKGSDIIPVEIEKDLNVIRQKQLLLMTFIEQQKVLLIEALQNAGVRFSILKGAAIARSLYQERWYYRKMVDMDILIDPEHLELAFMLLKKLGFSDKSSHPLGHKEFENISTGHHRSTVIEHTLVHQSGLLTLDIHWKLRRNHLLPITYNELFNSFSTDSFGTPRLNEHIEFIYLCVNGMNDGWRKLKSLVDILHYAKNLNDWNRMHETAKQLGVLHVVNASLAVCDLFFKTDLAPERLNKKEQILYCFVVQSYEKHNELPVVSAYLNNQSTITFVRTIVSWWMSLSSESISPLVIIKGLLMPNEDDFKGEVVVTNRRFYRYFFRRAGRLIKSYYLTK
ncbi:MAG: hypothetical protein AXW14_11450 [Alteromonas sp. Nap_26]|nr:MAG: hypothetical protein AXW14_11450 [Alteromonas sp. Nap_26]